MSTTPPELGVHHSSLRDGRDGLHTAATELRSRIEALATSIEALGPLGGADDISALIGEAYEAIHTAAFESLQTAMDALAQDGNTLDAMRVTFRVQERSTEQSIDSLRT
ncbi:hypothetical protein [Nonomuraea cavernae]|uniref:hypothetical protein n=1 Tax=Nonomuraea cavernae TaxID=2045107 RepID=UPI00340D1336